MTTDTVLAEVAAERLAQDAKFGAQNHPDGTGGDAHTAYATFARNQCQHAATDGAVTWRHILEEERAEAYAEEDPVLLRAELVQLAAVCVAWCEAIDRRRPGR